MSDAAHVEKLGYQVPVKIRSGVPICPDCGAEMVETSRDGNLSTYECPVGKQMLDNLRNAVLGAFDRAIAESSTVPVPLPDGSDTTRPSGKWPSITGSTDDR